jgi:hypothetical protein
VGVTRFERGLGAQSENISNSVRILSDGQLIPIAKKQIKRKTENKQKARRAHENFKKCFCK